MLMRHYQERVWKEIAHETRGNNPTQVIAAMFLEIMIDLGHATMFSINALSIEPFAESRSKNGEKAKERIGYHFGQILFKISALLSVLEISLPEIAEKSFEHYRQERG